MADDPFKKFLAKADDLSTTHRNALKDGRKLGTLQDHGIFLGPSAPAHLKNKLYPMATPQEIQARWDREAADPIIQKFGPGMTVMNLYHSPKGHYAVPGDPPSPHMAKVTPDELKRLWDAYFRRYSNPVSRVGTKLFLDAVQKEAARRGIM